jgi:GntR family transcriptional repressor for pyruvate dehydrogenase complex
MVKVMVRAATAPAKATARSVSPRKRQVGADLERVRAFVTTMRERGPDRLPPEREIVDELGITRSRLRGALKKLANEGIIWREVGNGTYFGQRPLVDQASAQTAKLSELTNPREVMEARLVLEPELARLAAYRARRENLTELDTCMKKMSDSSSPSDWSFWDMRFHWEIGRAADSTLLLILLETVQSNMNRGTWGELSDKLHRGSSSEGSMQDHEVVLTAIRNRNATGAHDAMREHLTRIERIYFGS